MRLFKLSLLGLIVWSFTYGQLTDPMLDVGYLFSDSTGFDAFINNPAVQKPENDRIAELEARYSKEIKMMQTEIKRLKNRVAQLESANPIRRSYYSSDVMKELYAKGLQYYSENNFDKARSVFTEIIEETTDMELKKSCMFWASECAFRVGNYNQVIIYSSELLNYNNFEKKDDAYILLAISYDKLGNSFEARKFYRKYLTEYPGAKYSVYAQDKLSAN